MNRLPSQLLWAVVVLLVLDTVTMVVVLMGLGLLYREQRSNASRMAMLEWRQAQGELLSEMAKLEGNQ